MRWFVLLLCSGVGALIGKLFELRKKKSVLFWQEAVSQCDALRDGIAFHRKSLADLLGESIGRAQTEWCDILTAFCAEMSESALAKTQRACQKSGLSQEECASILSLLKLLGRSDVSHQETLLNSSKETFLGYLERAQKEYEKVAKVSLKLGVLGGVAVGIVFA